MDDNYFDKKIRDKVEAYNDPGIDAGAINGLHSRLDSISPAIPWYKNRKHLGWAAAAVLFLSLLNSSLYSFVYQNNENELLNQIASLKDNQQELYELQQKLSNSPQIIHDTVYLYKEAAIAPRQIKDTELKNYLAVLSDEKRQQLLADYMPDRLEKSSSNDLGNGLMLNLDDAPDEVKSYLSGNNLYVSLDGKKVTVSVNHLDVPASPNYLLGKGITTAVLKPTIDTNLAFHQIGKSKDGVDTKKGSSVKDVYMSANLLRALEKNEMKKYGFRLGPSINFNKTTFDLGSNGINAGIGVLAELVLSPSIRIESGLDYSKVAYGLTPNEITNLTDEQFQQFPALNPDFGNINDINVDSDVIRIPFNLKYFYPISKKKRLFAGAGYAPMLLLSQHFEYNYDAGVSVGDEDDFRANLTAVKRKDNPKLFAGTMNLQLGMESQIRKNAYVQAAVFYQKGIDHLGAEEREIDMFGIRSSLFFRIK